MNLFALRKTADRILHPVVSLLARSPLSANHWTLCGTLVGLACGVAFWRQWYWLGLVLLLVRGLLDHVDGYVARNYDQRSIFGAVMDDVSDRWVLGIIYTGGCLGLAAVYPHVLVLMGVGITGALANVIIKQSIYAEARYDGFREEGKYGHPVDVVGLFGSAEFIIYFGMGALLTATMRDPRPMLIGIWAVAVMSHVSLLQRIAFARRYRGVDPAALEANDPSRPDTNPSTDNDDARKDVETNDNPEP